jgi:site-specific recombinase XerD
MGALRERMVREMQLREFSPSTRSLYLTYLTDLARYHHRAPDTLDGTQIQDYLLYLTRERHLAWSSVSVAASAIRFFYTQTLKRPEIAMAIPPRRKPRRLPHILSVEEVGRLLSSPRQIKHRLLLMTTYAAGLRVSEVTRLRVTDLDR